MKTDWISTAAAAAIVAGGVGLVFVHYYGGSPGSPDGWLSALGFAAPFIGAGFVGLVGTTRRRPELILAGGAAVALMSWLSIVLIPLAIPAAVLIARAAKAGVRPASMVLPIVLAAALVGALALLVFHQDPAHWSTPEGSGGSSNIVTTTEAVFAIAAAVTVTLIAILASGERTWPEAQSAPG